MRITGIDAYSLSSPIDPPQERSFHGGTRRIRKRDVIFVVVETADGEVGYAPAGATSSAMREYFENASHDDFTDVLEHVVAPKLAGEAVEDAETIRELIEALDLPAFLESQAVGTLDVAYHDIVGKRRGAPIYELLADDGEGDVTTTLPLYASAGMYMSPEGYADQAAALKAQGFSSYKYRPGIGPDEDVRTLEAIREAVGDEIDVMVDAHTWWKMGDRSYGFEEVAQVLNEFVEFDPYWIEEPVPPADYERYRELAAVTSLPLAGGESEESADGLLELADTGAVAFLQGDVRHHGGFTGCWRAVEHCRGRDVTFVPHNFGTHLGLVANAHLVAAAPETELLEYPVFGTDDEAGMYPFPLAADVLVDDLDVVNGRLRVPDGPGLGVEVDRDVVDDYPYIEGPWTEFHYDDSG